MSIPDAMLLADDELDGLFDAYLETAHADDPTAAADLEWDYLVALYSMGAI